MESRCAWPMNAGNSRLQLKQPNSIGGLNSGGLRPFEHPRRPPSPLTAAATPLRLLFWSPVWLICSCSRSLCPVPVVEPSSLLSVQASCQSSFADCDSSFLFTCAQPGRSTPYEDLRHHSTDRLSLFNTPSSSPGAGAKVGSITNSDPAQSLRRLPPTIANTF